MVDPTPRLALPRALGTANARDYLKGAISGGGLWAALLTLDQSLLQTLIAAKGDLLAGTANDAIAVLTVGANESFLVADSAQATGLRWNALTWTTFTPTLAQTGAVTITISYARYAIIGKTAIVQLKLSATSAGGGATGITIGSIPAAIAPARTGSSGTESAGVGSFQDATGPTYYGGVAIFTSATEFQIMTNNAVGFLGASPSITLASGDVIGADLVYELA